MFDCIFLKGLKVRSSNVLIKADPSGMIADASGLVSATATLASGTEAS